MNQDIFCLSVADVHGNITQYEKIKQLVIEQHISLVFLCGDLLPKDGGSWSPDNKIRTIQMQADFIHNYFIGYLTDLGKLATVCAIFGNDDFKSNYSLLSNINIPRVHFLDTQVIDMTIAGQKVHIAGYPYVGLTPFLHKDWEKRDLKTEQPSYKIYRTDGYVSEKGHHIATDISTHSSTIETDLQQLATMSPPQETIYVFHEAPYDTPLDMIASDNKYIKEGQLHIGSKAIRKFIEEKKPLVTLHGHIHETFDESGEYMWVSGRSVSLAPANDFTSDNLSYIVFPLADAQKATRGSA